SLDRTLLAALLDNGEAAVRAWQAWRASANIDEYIGFVDVAPMLSEQLVRLGVDDDETGRINGIRRRAWYANQLQMRQAESAVRVLDREGFDPILLGDLAAALQASEIGSVRPVRTVDLCVPQDLAAEAAGALARVGWTPDQGTALTKRRLERRTWQRFR